jgi:hypothetical protein
VPNTQEEQDKEISCISLVVLSQHVAAYLDAIAIPVTAEKKKPLHLLSDAHAAQHAPRSITGKKYKSKIWETVSLPLT